MRWGNQCVCKQICCWLWCVDTAHTQTALKTVRSLKSPIKNRAGPNDSATQKHWITVQTALQEKKHRPWSYKEAASKTKLRPTWTLVHRRAWKYRNRHTGSPMLRPSLRVQHRITRVRRKAMQRNQFTGKGAFIAPKTESVSSGVNKGQNNNQVI